MKRNIIAIVAAAVAAMAVSCTEAVLPANIQNEGTIAVSVNGLMGEYTSDEPGSKASLISNIRVSWEGDETVYVFDGTSCLGSLTASLNGDDDRIAVLSGSISTTSASLLTLVYCPTLSAAPAVKDGKISFDLSEQNATATPFVVYGTLPFDGTTITETIVPFNFATSVMKVNFTGFASSAQVQNAMISDVNTACVLSLSGSAAPAVSGAVNGTITRSGSDVFSLSGDGRGSFQMATVASAAATARELSILDSYNVVYESAFTPAALGTGRSYNTVFALASTLGYVDLGLPSGTLWGTQNVGVSATAPAGSLYAWGETIPKADYSWGTYKYCNGTEEYIIKYSCFADGGVCDFDQILDAGDDAANVIYGTQWRTPTVEEFYELVRNTECEAATVDGIEGIRLTSTVKGFKDESIFLPSDHYYWSSSSCLESGNDKLAYNLMVFNDVEMMAPPMITPYSALKCNGLYVRPVYSKIIPATSLSFALDAISVCVGSTTDISYTLSPRNCLDKNLIWTVGDPEIVAVSNSGRVIGLKEGTTTITATWVDDASISASCSVTVVATSKAEAIDLGLTSGTKWASFNLGAASEYEGGSLYAWGETSPRFEDAINDYKWEDEDGKEIKYNVTDGLTELLPEDDAATQVWGAGWSIPSSDDWAELVQECDFDWDSATNTVIVEGPNGNTIKIYNTPYDGVSSMTYYYWTSSRYYWAEQPEHDYFAWHMLFYEDDEVDTGYADRCIVCLIRPVYKTTE